MVKNKQSGITLIALVITIIVLLILAGVTISVITGDRGVVKKAVNAKEETEMAKLKENVEMLRAEANINAYKSNNLGQYSMLEKEGLLNLINGKYKNSTRNGNRITTADGKYDIVVKNNLDIVVVPKGASYLKKGEMEISYFVPTATGAKSKTIFLYFELGTDDYSKSQQTYWQYAKSKTEGLSEEELESTLMAIHGMTSKEQLYQRLCGATNENDVEIKLESMGMTYKEALELSYMRSIGGITQPVIDYLKDVKGKKFDAEEFFEALMQDEAQRAELEAAGITDLDSYLEAQSRETGRSKEEIKAEMEAWSMFIGAFTELAKKGVILYKPDGTQEEVSELMMYAEYTVKENGDYTFRAEGYNGEKEEITVPVTGIGKDHIEFTDEELVSINDKTTKFIINSGDDGKVILPVSTDERVIVDWGDGNETVNDVKESGRVNESPDGWLEHEFTETNKEYTVIIKGNIHLIDNTKSTKNKILEVVDWGDSDLVKINFASCSNLRSIAVPRTNSFKNLEKVERAFYGCTNLVSIPNSFFDGATRITSFAETFADCNSLSRLPEGLFDDCTNVTSFDRTFYGCTQLTGSAPELWNRSGEVSGMQCFSQCYQLDNFENIPSDWRYMPEPH